MTIYKNPVVNKKMLIKNAKSLLNNYGNRTDYANHNPSTTMHKLVIALNDYLKEFKEQFDKQK